MCGFAGEFLFCAGRADQNRVETMAESIFHRGPDESGTYLSPDKRCAIGFRRLSVIDPISSHQPMVSDDKQSAIAFNGEIYNFLQIREKLQSQGTEFHTSGDTEVLLNFYLTNGCESISELVGMFAFALYDNRKGQLILARDRLGQKPLWYAELADRVVFASEAKALLKHPMVKRDCSPESISDYLSIGYVPSPASAWVGIKKLPPGSVLIFGSDKGCVEFKKYWQPATSGQATANRAELVDAVRETVKEAVRLRMLSDVPLGALLSGGIDSAVVVSLMCKEAGRAGGVRTFTAGFEDPRYDERADAKILADYCGTEHTELMVKSTPEQIKQMLDRVVSQYDEPFADSSALPTYLICQAARQHVTVALAGDGGDEVFGGYDRYRAMLLGQTMNPAKYLAVRIAAALARPFAGLDERNKLRRFIRFADGLSLPPALQYSAYRQLFSPDDLLRLFTPAYLAETDLDVYSGEEWFCGLYEQGEFDSEVANAQRHDLMTYLPDDLLVKTDIAAMAGSLELRAPLLDHQVVELGLSLPVEMKVNTTAGKLILREAFGDLLPAEVFEKPKRGFGLPLGSWLREELRDEMIATLTDPALKKMGIFQEEALVGLMNDHISGRADHRHRLWVLMVLGRWLTQQ